jgi:hypothetical protein
MENAGAGPVRSGEGEDGEEKGEEGGEGNCDSDSGCETETEVVHDGTLAGLWPGAGRIVYVMLVKEGAARHRQRYDFGAGSRLVVADEAGEELVALGTGRAWNRKRARRRADSEEEEDDAVCMSPPCKRRKEGAAGGDAAGHE